MKKNFALMGILNVTPDSFSDGGLYFGNLDKIIDRAAKIIEEGGEIIDVGAESTRPGASEISVDEELNRIIPAVENIRKRFDVTISIDTRKSEVAKQTLALGANWINDVSGGKFDKKIPEIIAKTGATAVVMHSRENPLTMQDNPHYGDVISEVKNELQIALNRFLSAGVSKEKIILDPGIGFAKRYEDNINLTANLDKILIENYPILYAASRKKFIAQAIESETGERLCGGLAAVAAAYLCGARIFRVHDVRETSDFLKVFSELCANSILLRKKCFSEDF
ncbi:MAG: dihydropteroate synthase [Chitinivibrionia bacterium]|nr:dihydropteroate synthase [Chitinivibrionia bacterium]